MSQLETISREIFTQVRTTIVLNMRFMDIAVFRLNPMWKGIEGVMTSGNTENDC